MNCSICNKPIEKSQKAKRWVSGWESVRRAGEGVDPLQGRQVHGPHAHAVCIDIELKGQRHMQESLLG